ncbi:cysteine proteinase inhibitor 1-like [Impatiens glandulifera]|uniref:cysteine proteinase inhibitor 1-like n=1 Tax=Impatiens glandulifera TaxID=253017 RepID=UPI001FB0680B|nr:cysteine proteinase inhibitor 1-like [Impatiens glandulifera]
MASKQFILFVLLVSLFSCKVNSAALGGWEPISDPKDSEIVEIGKYAISEYNIEAKTTLEFNSVVKGDTQVVAGTNYRLVIAAKDGEVVGKYEAIVWDKPWEKFRKLISFQKL